MSFSNLTKFELRFNYDIDSYEEACFYFANRSKQMLASGFTLFKVPIQDLGWGARAFFQRSSGELYQSVYVYSTHRRQGYLKHFINSRTSHDYPWVTTPECNLYNWFIRHNVSCFLTATNTLELEYKAISKFYGNKKAKRAGIFYMNHIDEGLYILEQINASDDAKRAFCLHPIVQADKDLIENQNILNSISINPKILALAMEYRSVANDFLSPKKEITEALQIRLSPLKDVNDMLVADKIQNYKDFLLYHNNTHPNSNRLNHYFKIWLERLKISQPQFKRIEKELL